MILCAGSLVAQNPPTIIVNWTKKIHTHTVPTLQAVVNPMLRRGSPIHDPALAALHDLGCDYVRYAFWFPYPKLSVAELKPPDKNQTYWDFQYMDPLVDDFYNASGSHPAVWSFSTIPQWMFTTPAPVIYPEDPNQVMWNYSQGKDLPDLKALGDYYGRLASWYTKGGFTDELGKFHSSGHHYDMRYWEVFNEIDGEHEPTPAQYVERYDTIVEAVRKVDPDMKFVGLALSYPEGMPRMFEYFLDPKNHKPGIPIDYISFHVYAAPSADQTLDQWQYTFFGRANEFLAATRYILRFRDILSPSTKIMINEAGSILSGDMVQGEPNHVEKPIPPAYWNLSGALYAYLYIQLANLGVDTVGESQLVGFPSQFPSVSMIDWTTGKPNARLTILDLLKKNVGPGDDFADTEVHDNGIPADSDGIAAQAYVSGNQRKMLLINERNRDIVVELPKDCAGGTVQMIGGASPDLVKQGVTDLKLHLLPFAVTVVTLKD
ncbi:MAG TPA: hypothetical protein VMD76_04980 [Candidatus Sulfotelmatobacter sp.]|nr:hypothetical protein [Candidatus Sulfotelmatobacter sp.]